MGESAKWALFIFVMFCVAAIGLVSLLGHMGVPGVEVMGEAIPLAGALIMLVGGVMGLKFGVSGFRGR